MAPKRSGARTAASVVLRDGRVDDRLLTDIVAGSCLFFFVMSSRMRCPPLVLVTGLWSCSSEPPSPVLEPPGLQAAASETAVLETPGKAVPSVVPRRDMVLLARHPELLERLSLPERSRPVPVSDIVGLTGPWTVDRVDDRVVQYRRSAPIRGIEWGFGRSQAPVDVLLRDSGGRPVRWRHTRDLQQALARTWDVSRGALRIRRMVEQSEPNGWTLVVPRLAELEMSLQYGGSGLPPEQFALRTMVDGGRSRHGLFLPAPAEAHFAMPNGQTSEGARLRTTVRLLDPFVPHSVASDGAVVVVRADDREIHRAEVSPGEPVVLDVAVPPSKTLSIITEPGGSSDLDYVFFEEPAVGVIGERPRRVLVILIDTLRADRLGAYGYTHHDTSPVIDRLAARGVRFDQARAPAPWTLPSTRALLSGHAPEAWSPTDHLGQHLARSGFATAFISTNTYLSRYVDMHRGWTLHDHGIARSGPQQVERMQAFLDAHPDRDVAVVLHVMEPHMPYREPESLRRLWAGEKPAELDDDFNVQDLRRVEKQGRIDAAIRTWVSDRYDQNVRAADETVALALDAMGPDALVVLTADHGEELWEHGDVEHGHALWEELVRVPLVVAGPGIAAGVVNEPVSLVDVAPTLYGLLGVSAEAAGVDLGPALVGTPMPQLRSRPQAFRNLLYRSDAYGVLVDGHQKWIAREGRESIYDLAIDPHEQTPTGRSAEPFRAALGEALGRDVVLGWRIAFAEAGEQGNRRKAHTRESLSVTHPGGIEAVFSAPDPRERSALNVQPIPNGFQLDAVPGTPLPAEIYVVSTARPDVDTNAVVTVTSAVFPMPADSSLGVIEIDADAKEALEALGYIE